MQQILNTVPFSLKNGDYGVEVVDPLEAQIFDMDVISDEFKPSAPTIADHIWGFFTGKIQKKNKTKHSFVQFQYQQCFKIIYFPY